MKKLLFFCSTLFFLISCWGTEIEVSTDMQVTPYTDTQSNTGSLTDIDSQNVNLAESIDSNESIDSKQDYSWLSPELQLIIQKLEGRNPSEIALFDCTQSEIEDILTREQYINDCLLLKKQAEIAYYNSFLALNIDEVHPMQDDFMQEYQEYTKTVPSYDEFISTNWGGSEINLPYCSDLVIDDEDVIYDCIITQEEYENSIWKLTSYEDFVSEKQAEIIERRNNFELQKSEYRRFIDYLQNSSN